MNYRYIVVAAVAAIAWSSGAVSAQGQQTPPMGFFVTSTTHSGNLGGLAGADAECQRLAAAAGAGNRTWRAYLSTQGTQSAPAVNARDRIGNGPWYNADGVMIAADLDELHINPNLKKSTALNEKGEVVNGFGDSPNVHDALTGTMGDGTAYFPDADDHTCNNWTSSNEGSAAVGHTDRMGGGNVSWNSAHASRGCSQESLVATGGAGMFYCFAIN